MPSQEPGPYRSQLSPFDQIHDVVLATDCQCTIVYWNRAAERMHGYPASEVVGKHITLTIPPDEYARICEDNQRDRPQRDRIKAFDTVMITKAGRRIPTNLRLQPLYGEDASPIGLLVIAIDRTSELESQARLLAQERGLRDTITRELHHRVKNSLQSAVGLLRMETSKHPALAESAAGAISQLLATAVGFGLLGSTGSHGVRLADMIREIASNVSQITGRSIEVNIDTSMTQDPPWLGQELIMNVGLIINELLINAVKHALPRGEQPPPGISVFRDADVATVKIFNPGGNLPEGFSFAHGAGLGTGLTLVRMLLPNSGCAVSFTHRADGVLALVQIQLSESIPANLPA